MATRTDPTPTPASRPTVTHGRVVIGVDGSPASQHALEVARAEAELRDALLEVVWAWRSLDLPHPMGTARAEVWAADHAERLAVPAMAGPRQVLSCAVRGLAGPVLVQAAEAWQADLVVVGAHGSGLRAHLPLGSVSEHVVNHSTVPVMVVRGGDWWTPVALGGPIVVGVDGSDPSRRALRWALHEADRRRTEVVAVHGWRRQPELAGPVPGEVTRDELLAGAAERLVRTELAAVDDVAPHVPRRASTPALSAWEAMLAATEPGGLAVVGCRGRGSLVHRALGSVSHQVVALARVPVVTVR